MVSLTGVLSFQKITRRYWSKALFVLLFFSHTAFGGENCDIVGKNLAEISTQNQEACAKECETRAACKAWVFVSGWNHCSLKGEAARQVSLRMHSAAIEVESGNRQLTKIQEGFDHKGKDLRRVTGVKTSTACGEVCLEESQCQGFVYLDGYKDCWLKKTPGKFRPKVFYCGVK